jgi:hypothetical protein
MGIQRQLTVLSSATELISARLPLSKPPRYCFLCARYTRLPSQRCPVKPLTRTCSCFTCTFFAQRFEFNSPCRRIESAERSRVYRELCSIRASLPMLLVSLACGSPVRCPPVGLHSSRRFTCAFVLPLAPTNRTHRCRSQRVNFVATVRT